MEHALAHGQIFAGYRIERLIGVNGAGEVYLAHDRNSPRVVALALLSRALTNDSGVRSRYKRIGGTVASPTYPGITTVYDRGEHGGRMWIAMQYVDGSEEIIVRAIAKDDPWDLFGRRGEAAAEDSLTEVHPPNLTKTTEPQSNPRPPKWRGHKKSIAILGLVVVLVGLGVAVVEWRDSARRQQSSSSVQAAAREAACEFGLTFATYDYTDMDEHKRAVDDRSTDPLRADFDSSWPTTRSRIEEAKLSSQPIDAECTFKSGDSTRAEVAVIVNLPLANPTGPPSKHPVYMLVTMVQDGGRWLCADMADINQPK